MKVVHIVESFASGTFNFISDLTQNLAIYEYIIIHGERIETPPDFRDHFPKSTRFIYWKNATRELSFKKDLLALFELINILKTLKNTDVIHLHSSKAGFLGRIAARILGWHAKVIYTPHAASFLRLDISNYKQKLFILFEKIAAFFGGQIVACSKSEAEAFLKIGIQSNHINNSVFLKIDSPTKSTPSDSITIATTGRISHQKNPILFNHIAKYYLANPQINFIWIGDGELNSVLQSSNINVTGWLKKNQALTQLSQTDIYLSTSLWEGLPISVLQAMYLQKPLVLSDCIGNKDLIGDNGFLCKNTMDFINAIDYLISSAKIRHELGVKSYVLYKNSFSPKQMLENYNKIYLDITRRP